MPNWEAIIGRESARWAGVLAGAFVGLLLVGAREARADAAAVHPADVRIEMTDEMGPVLADARGHTLYTWRGDRRPGQSNCTSTRYNHANGAGSMSYEIPESNLRPSCVQIWPPLVAAADAKPVGSWSIINRDDGIRQWAIEGKPLYTFVQDSQPGEINGAASDGRFNSGRYPAWATLDAPHGILALNSKVGRVLMTEGGKTLYVFKGGLTKTSNNAAWKPLPAPALVTEAAPKGWSVLAQPDGNRQWVYQGKAVFTYGGDARYADQNGAQEPGWQAITLQRPLAPPSDLSIQLTSEGQVFSDSKGMTLYTFGCADEGPDRAVCDIPGMSQTYRLAVCGKPATCIKNWRPVIASRDARPVGRTWSIVLVDPTGANQFALPGQKDALRVWAYRGRPVYTSALDEEPGDFNGDRIGNFGAGGVFTMLRVVADPRGQF